jgi:hypothetical protein
MSGDRINLKQLAEKTAELAAAVAEHAAAMRDYDACAFIHDLNRRPESADNNRVVLERATKRLIEAGSAVDRAALAYSARLHGEAEPQSFTVSEDQDDEFGSDCNGFNYDPSGKTRERCTASGGGCGLAGCPNAEACEQREWMRGR